MVGVGFGSIGVNPVNVSVFETEKVCPRVFDLTGGPGVTGVVLLEADVLLTEVCVVEDGVVDNPSLLEIDVLPCEVCSVDGRLVDGDITGVEVFRPPNVGRTLADNELDVVDGTNRPLVGNVADPLVTDVDEASVLLVSEVANRLEDRTDVDELVKSSLLDAIWVVDERG